MKVVVTSQGEGLDAQMDARFGRARWLVIYDTESQVVENIDNSSNYNAAQGAGIKTAEMVLSKDCDVVISGHLGPKAFKVLRNTDIKCYLKEKGTVKEALNEFAQKKLTESHAADVKEHW